MDTMDSMSNDLIKDLLLADPEFQNMFAQKRQEFYVEMINQYKEWQKKGDIQLSPKLAKRCSLKLVTPDPTTEQITYAMSLSTDAEPDNALGQLFTQTVMITCSTEKG